MTANPIELIAGLFTSANVSKADIDAWAKARVAQVLANAAEVNSTNLAGQLMIKIKALGGDYFLDSTDSTTADDGVTCIISLDGFRFKPVQSRGIWTPAFTGFSTAPSGGSASYVKQGRMVFCRLTGFTAGTSNATTKTVTLPFAAMSSGFSAMGRCSDSGVAQNNPCRIDLAAASAIATLYKDLAADAWTASGSCLFEFAFAYEATA